MSAEPLGFEPIWQAIKGWNIQREHGAGYHGPTGDDVRAILSALAAAGYAVVPVKPTEAMLAAGEEERRWVRMSRQRVRLESHWGAMLAAAKETQA